MILNKEEIIEFYPLKFKVNQTEYCTLWYTDEIDGFLQDENKKIKFFANVGEAKAFTESKGYSIDSEVLQITDDILKKLDMQILDCNVIITCWNILSDMAKSIDCDFLGDSKSEEIQNIYDKLFYGCNLPSLKKSGEDFLPKWADDEKNLIKKVLKNGFEVLQRALKLSL